MLKPSTVFRDVDAPWCPEMVALPAGTFLMSSPEDEEGRYEWEGPQHPVTIGYRFAIGRYPVVFGEYDYFCDATKREKPGDEGWGRGRRPVINVSWRDARAYVEWLGRETRKPYRLPSEAEWEYACRAGTTTPYSFGNGITPKNANYKDSKLGMTTEVDSYPPNPWGLYDMHGNVWEWVEDVLWLESYTHGALRRLLNWQPSWVRAEDFRQEHRGLRGGSWFDDPEGCRSATRNALQSVFRGSEFGFRVVRMLD